MLLAALLESLFDVWGGNMCFALLDFSSGIEFEKTLMLGKIEGRRRRGQQRMRLVGWHHQLNGHESV